MSKTVLIFDRGFRRASLIKLLQTHSQPFLIRLISKIRIQGQSYSGLLSAFTLRQGQIVDLGLCRLRGDGVVLVRVIGLWAKGQKEPWWLCTSMTNQPRKVAALYDRRMGVEECFRDSKGCRLGMQIKWTHFTREERINRLFLLAAIALILWTVAGVLAVRDDPSLRWICKSRGPRRSLVAIGRESEYFCRKVFSISWKTFATLWPQPTLRSFQKDLVYAKNSE